MRARRRRSFAAVVGRMPIPTPEAEAALLAPSAASRILDLLLSLPGAPEREALLPECFAPPPDWEAQPGGGARAGVVEGDETDELWCTPLQLLNEIDARARDVVEGGGGSSRSGGGGSNGSGGGSTPLLGGGHGLSGAAYAEALALLRAAVAGRWVDTLPGGGGIGEA
jgi:hypothetical protein